MKYLELSASQQRQVLRDFNVPRSDWPEEEVCLLWSPWDGPVYLLGLLDGLGPKAVWCDDTQAWEPL